MNEKIIISAMADDDCGWCDPYWIRTNDLFPVKEAL